MRRARKTPLSGNASLTHLYHALNKHTYFSVGYDVREVRVALQTPVGGLHDGLLDASGFGVHAQGVVDGVLRRLGTGGLSHVQGPSIGAAEGGGEALMSFKALAQGVPARGLAGLAKTPANHLDELVGDDGDEQMAFGADGLVMEDGAQAEFGFQRAEHRLDVGQRDVGTLDGTASFTSLAVYADGTPEIFAGGSLHYPFTLSANSITGIGTGSTLRAGFHGPGHESVAGTLHDPLAGLLASFGAARDERLSRGDVVGSADYLLGSSYRGGAVGLVGAGWSQYRCGTDSGCVSRHAGPEAWSDWTATTRSAVLASTAGWSWRSTERPHADHDFVRIARQRDEIAESPLGPRVVESHTGTLEHVAFGSGVERSAIPSTLSGGAFPDTDGFFDGWAGVQGTLSGAQPDVSARWSGPMLGYQGGRPARRDAAGGGARQHRILLLRQPVRRGFLRGRKPRR